MLDPVLPTGSPTAARRDSTPDGREAGFALPVAIFALAMMAVMITGGIFASRQESRISTATGNAATAFYLTERGLNETIMDWDPSAFAALGTFGQVTQTGTAAEGNWTVQVTKLGDRLFYLQSQGTVTEGGTMLAGGQHQQGLMARMEILDIDPPAALVTRGEVRVGGTAEIHGGDEVPAGWGGFCGPTTDKPGVMNPDASDVSTFGSGEITGSPAVQEDASIGDDTFTNFGGLSWAELVAMADKPLSGGTFSTIEPVFNGDGTCDRSSSTNWGDPIDPTSECGNFFPIVYINGNARMQGGGVGQGILLVEGNLDLRGGFIYHGIIIVQGSFETQGSGNRVLGGVYASNADVDDQTVTGGSVTQNSTCAVTRALLNNSATARARPLDQRPWIDITSVTWVN